MVALKARRSEIFVLKKFKQKKFKSIQKSQISHQTQQNQSKSKIKAIHPFSNFIFHQRGFDWMTTTTSLSAFAITFRVSACETGILSRRFLLRMMRN